MHNYQVYRITNKINNKQYIGLTRRPIRQRWIEYKGSDHGYIGRSIQKHGIDNFKFEVIYICIEDDEDHLKKIETQLIKEYDTFNNGYNLDTGGTNGIGFHTKETKARISKKISGKNNGMYGTSRKGRDNPNYGKKWSNEKKKKLSDKKKEFLKDKNNHPMYGKKHTNEAKKKIGLSNRGKTLGIKRPKRNKEWCKKISISKMGIKTGPRPCTRIHYLVTTPDEKNIVVENLQEFCLTYNLKYSSMWRAGNKNKIHKGYKVQKI